MRVFSEIRRSRGVQDSRDVVDPPPPPAADEDDDGAVDRPRPPPGDGPATFLTQANVG